MLRESLLRWARTIGGRDPRDEMLSMAPFHHCAKQLGLEPAQLFADVASELPPKSAEFVREFGARKDIRPSSFGFELQKKGPDGPFYGPKP